jgi:hypothetical protein
VPFLEVGTTQGSLAAGQMSVATVPLAAAATMRWSEQRRPSRVRMSGIVTATVVPDGRWKIAQDTHGAKRAGQHQCTVVAVREPDHVRQGRAGLDESIGEAHAEVLVFRYAASSQDQVEGVTVADRPGGANCPTVDQRDAPPPARGARAPRRPSRAGAPRRGRRWCGGVRRGRCVPRRLCVVAISPFHLSSSSPSWRSRWLLTTQRVAQREVRRLGLQILVERRGRALASEEPGTNERRSVYSHRVNDLHCRALRQACNKSTK